MVIKLAELECYRAAGRNLTTAVVVAAVIETRMLPLLFHRRAATAPFGRSLAQACNQPPWRQAATRLTIRMASSSAQAQRRLAEEFVQGYSDFTVESLLKPRAENCEHHMLPTNLNRPVRTNQDYEKFFGVLKENMSDFEVCCCYVPHICSQVLTPKQMTAHRFVNDPDEKTIAVYATGTAKTPWGPYDNSYVFFLKCEGEKIVRIDEFVDSKFSTEFFEKMQAYSKGQNK